MISLMIGILFSSNLVFAVCPYAKNLQGNASVGMFDEESNFYNKANVIKTSASGQPGAVQRRK